MSAAPANIEAEAELLGSLMQPHAQIDRVADMLSPHDFYLEAHARIYAKIVQQAALGKSANPVALRSYFENDESLRDLDGVRYLFGLTASASGLAVVECAELVLEAANRRKLEEVLRAAAEACADFNIPIAEIVAQADALLADDSQDTINQPTAGDALDELIRRFDEKPASGVRSHVIAALDSAIGPMRPKQLIIGAGRPGMGKTSLALSYSLGAANAGHGVLFVSLEMSTDELSERIAADQCFDRQTSQGVPYSAIQTDNLTDWQRRRVIEAASRLRSLPFQIIDTGGLTVGRLNTLIRRHARRMEARGQRLELVVVDYLQLLTPDIRGRSSYEAVSEISRALKVMAKDHGVAILALSQLSREVEKRADKRPQLSDLRDSGSIEQDADAVLFLLRQEYYLASAQPDPMNPDHGKWSQAMDAVRGQIEFIVAKRRNGTTGSAFGQWHGAFQAVRG